jgi:hypothetical protein
MRLPRRFLSACAALACASLASVWAQSPAPTITAVEEDWQLVVAEPDVPGVGPQITTCMRPGGDTTAPFVAFDMNYREYPTFQVGGMQIQVWKNNSVVATASGQGTAQFQTAGETVTWTQRMSVSNGTCTFGIDNGQSTTWGKFGQGQGLLAVSYATTFADMAAYSPSTSVAASGVSWEPNLAGSLAIVRVRYYANGQLVATDTNPHPVSLTKTTTTN